MKKTMKKSLSAVLAMMIFATILLLPACQQDKLVIEDTEPQSSVNPTGSAPANVEEKLVVKVSDSCIVIKTTKEAMDGKTDMLLIDYMNDLISEGKLTCTISNGMVTSINGIENPADYSSCWMLYTSDAENANASWGTVEYEGEDLLKLNIEERSRKGLFLGFQYPVEIPGVTMANFMKIAVNEQRKAQGLEPLTAAEYLKLMREKSAIVELDAKLTSRAVNEGFSGGEKKKNEIFQMAMLNPKLAILDETDSGLDIDALRIVATGVTRLKTPENATVVITHYQRLLDYIVPDYVHVLYKGRIIYTGDKSLALKLEKEGYDWLINDYKEE